MRGKKDPDSGCISHEVLDDSLNRISFKNSISFKKWKAEFKEIQLSFLMNLVLTYLIIAPNLPKDVPPLVKEDSTVPTQSRSVALLLANNTLPAAGKAPEGTLPSRNISSLYYHKNSSPVAPIAETGNVCKF